MLIALLLLIIPACISLVLTPYIQALAHRVGAVDQPDKRKIHTIPMPRLGGVGIVLAVVSTGVGAFILVHLIGNKATLPLDALLPGLIGGGIVFLAGIWDDIRPIPVWVKFVFQLMAASVAIWFDVRIEQVSLFGSESIELGWLSIPLTALWLVGITNAFNLIDGLDGLAVGLGIIAACSSVMTFLLLGNVQEAFFLLPLIGALLGFLVHNFYPATIFLGDSGSMFTGYMLAVTAVSGTQKGPQTLSVIIPLLILGIPIIDTLLSMARRFVRSLRLFQSYKVMLREGITCMFQPDQRHIHHRLLALGFSHRNTVLFLYALGLGLSFLALMSVLAQYRNAGVVLIAVAMATYIGTHKLGYEEVALLRARTLLRWYEQMRFNRYFFLGFVDMSLILLAYWGAFYLKYTAPWPEELTIWYLNTFPFVLVTQLIVFCAFGLYRGVWRAAEVSDLIHVGAAVPPAVALAYIIAVLRVPPPGVFSFFWIDALALGTLIIGSRSTYQLLNYFQRREQSTEGTALIYGADRGGQLVLRALLHNPHLGLRPIGFLDDNASLWGRLVNRVPVLGSGDDLETIIENQSVSTLIIAFNTVQDHRVRRVIHLCHERGITVLQGCIEMIPVGTNGAGLHKSVVSDSPSLTPQNNP